MSIVIAAEACPSIFCDVVDLFPQSSCGNSVAFELGKLATQDQQVEALVARAIWSNLPSRFALGALPIQLLCDGFTLEAACW
jgi:hypothetical protein